MRETTPISPAQSLRRGRFFLAAGLAVPGICLAQSFVEAFVKQPEHWISLAVGYALPCIFIYDAYRGGRWTLTIIQGLVWVAFLCCLLWGVATLILAADGYRGADLGSWLELAPALGTTLAGLALAVWALLYSRDVKAFLAAQRTKELRWRMES